MEIEHIREKIHDIRAQRVMFDYDLAEKITLLEHKYDRQFKDITEVLNLLLDDKEVKANWEERVKISFKKT